MNANFQPRRFTIAGLPDMLHRIRLEYVDFCEFLENPWVDYDPHEMEVSNEPPSYSRFRMHGEPHYMRFVFINFLHQIPEWPIHVRADDEDALAIIPFNLGRNNVPEATPPPPPSLSLSLARA
ncbi:hypothetical protein ACJIZ3_008887 [Penstemon smallii]|uniref:Uncharacterized protein n=1 Tax=Penstemon smallii TaxID=265156 RepID=A0ABD3TC38_9LAMI